MKIKMELVFREIAGEGFLVPVGSAVKLRSGLFPLSETGVFLWKRLPEAETEDELTDALTDAYDVDRETAAQDVSEFLQKLRSFDVI